VGGGYVYDESRTPHGRAEATVQHQVDLAVARGIPREEAELEIRGGGINPEHFHPGAWHPRTVAEALDYEKQLIHARGNEEERVAKVRDRGRKETDPRWEERRRGWIKRLGGEEPINQLQQDIVDSLADGDEPTTIIQKVPGSQRAEAERYIGRAVRLRARQTTPPLGAEPNK
jgi:hypothetical protein